MAKDRKKLIHIHSSIPDKQPTPQSLAVGEIAVNNAADQEFLSIKNSEDKVKRFSSDEQMITWMEKKEVMPYVGYVRGGAGPSATSAATPTADNYGSYGILESDLSGNTSEIVIKLNQVAASATTKHERVNGSKDRYDKDVNPTTDSGVNDGAGFFIDMSRYAMQGANPEFSGITNTCYTNLNGTTRIKGVGGACGSLLDITVNSAKTDIETANTEITSATTVIGTNTTTISGNTTLNVSGTTTETKKGNVTETNFADKQESTSGNSYNDVKLAYSGTTGGTTTEIKVGNVTESHSGTTTENKKGDVTENNLANKTENTTGNVVENTTGTTTITRTGDVKILDKSNHYDDVNGNYSGTTTGTTTEVKVGNVTESHSGTTTENKKGDVTVNNQANFTMNTSGTTTLNTTGTTTIQSTGADSDVIVYAKDDLCETSDDVAAFKGANKTNVGIDCSDAGRTKVTNVYGDTINVRGNTADTRITSAYTSATTATTIIGTANTSATTADYSGNTLSSHVKSLTHSGDTLNITESSSTTVQSPSTTISGCTKIELITDELNFKQCTTGTVNFNFCDGFGAKSDDIKFEECTNNAGKIVIKENATEISGKTLTIRESGATDFSGATLTTTTTGNTTMNVSGNTAINTSGTTTLTSTGTTTIEATGTNSDVCISATDSARVYGNGSTYVGVKCDGTIGSATTIEGTTLVLSGNTTNISGATTLNLSGKTVNVDATDIDVDASNSYCLSAATKANIYGNETNIGVECGGSTATTVNMSGTTINEGGTNINENFTNGTLNITNYDLNGANICISGSTKANVYGATTNVGIDCNGTTTANTINVSGTTINEGGTTLNENFQDYDINASKTYCVSATTNANFYGNTTNIGVDCGGTTATTINISGGTINEGGTTNNNNFTTINNTATTINNKTTNFNITGDTYISGDTEITGNLTIPITCSTITSRTVNDALCETMSRSVVTMTREDAPSDSRLSAIYRIYQNGAQIGNGTSAIDINVPKDGFLKTVELVDDHTPGVFELHFVWNVYDADTQTYTTGETYVNMEELVKDIDDKNPSDTGTAANHNVVVDVHYDSTDKKMVVSAETTPTMHVTNMYASSTISAATANITTGNVTTLNAGTTTISGATKINNTLNVTGNTTLAATSASSLSATSVSSPTISGTNITAATKITTKDLDVTGNVVVTGTVATTGGLTKKLTWAAGAFTADTTGYNGSADKVITIPKDLSDLTSRGKLTINHNGSYGYTPGDTSTFTLPHSTLSIDYGANVTGRTDDTYDTSAEKTIYIPTSVKNLSNWNGSCYEFDGPLCITGTVTASGAIYSSDRNLKENIKSIDAEDINKVAAIDLKSFNFIDDESKTKVYGVIAQEVQEAGLDVLVHQNEDGMLGVDYTSLLILKIAQLQKDNNNLVNFVASLDKRVKELEEKLEKKD